MTRKIHQGPGLGLLAGILAAGVLVGVVIWSFSDSEVSTRSIRNFVKIGLIIAAVFAWVIHKAVENSRKGTRTRPARAARQRNRTVPVVDLTPPVPAVPAVRAGTAAPAPLVEEQLDLDRWVELAAATSLRFEPGPPVLLLGEFQGRSLRIEPRPRALALALQLAEPVSAKLAATVEGSGELMVETPSPEFEARFRAGDAPVWMAALGNARLEISAGEVKVETTGLVTERDVIRGLQEAAAAGARTVEGGHR